MFANSSEQGYFKGIWYKKIKDDVYLLVNEFGNFAFLSSEELFLSRREPSILEAYNLVYSPKNQTKFFERLKRKLYTISRGPLLHIIVLNNFCNLDCIYCHVSAFSYKSHQAKEISNETIDLIINRINEVKTDEITVEFQGGEPLLSFEKLRYAVQQIKKKVKKKITFVLATNLTLLNEEHIKFLKDNNIVVSTDFEGEREIHNKLRSNSFDLVYHNIKLAKENGISVNAHLTFTRLHVGKEEEIVENYYKLGLKSIWVRELYPNKSYHELLYTPEQFIAFWKKVLVLIRQRNIQEKTFSLFLDSVLGRFLYTELLSPCGFGKVQILYNYDGKIFGCDYSRNYDVFQIGTVHNSLKEIFQGNNFRNLYASTFIENFPCNNCIYKPFCGQCIVHNYALTGGFQYFDKNKCKIKKAIFEEVFKHIYENKHQFLTYFSKDFPKYIKKASNKDKKVPFRLILTKHTY